MRGDGNGADKAGISGDLAFWADTALLAGDADCDTFILRDDRRAVVRPPERRGALRMDMDADTFLFGGRFPGAGS